MTIPSTTPLLRALPLLTALVSAAPISACAARGAGGVTNVVPIQVREGSSSVARFAPDGRQAVVVAARMPGASSPSLMALLPREGGWNRNDGWDVVTMPGAGGAPSATYDPHGGTGVFARAKIRGMPATLLLAASPATDDPQPPGQPRRMELLTYRLDAGQNSATFDLIDRHTSPNRYCTPADAIARQYGIALPGGAGLCQRVS